MDKDCDFGEDFEFVSIEKSLADAETDSILAKLNNPNDLLKLENSLDYKFMLVNHTLQPICINDGDLDEMIKNDENVELLDISSSLQHDFDINSLNSECSANSGHNPANIQLPPQNNQPADIVFSGQKDSKCDSSSTNCQTDIKVDSIDCPKPKDMPNFDTDNTEKEAIKGCVSDENTICNDIAPMTVYLNRNVVTQFEKDSLPEFFAGKYDRTHFRPEQYLKIRNLFLTEWKARKPSPVKFRELVKTHKGIGNVVSFSRVCKFLTNLRLINHSLSNHNNMPHVNAILVGDCNSQDEEIQLSSDTKRVSGNLTDNNNNSKSSIFSLGDESKTPRQRKPRKRKSYYMNEMSRLGIDPNSALNISLSEMGNAKISHESIIPVVPPSQTQSESCEKAKDQIPEPVENFLTSSDAKELINVKPCSPSMKEPEPSPAKKPYLLKMEEGTSKCNNSAFHLIVDGEACRIEKNSSKHNGFFYNASSFQDHLSSRSNGQTVTDKNIKSNHEPSRITHEDFYDTDESVLINHNGTKKRNRQTRPNPFKLVACEKYGNNIEAPFTLLLSVEALAIIDVHSHCVQTEVIGLLGGLYCSKYRQLKVLAAEPCESLTATTDDLQCEMDPVSQANASERLSKAGYNVIGWYHSHPTFAPNPSLRDLETQAKYQQLFAEGNKPFLALILNPFSSLSKSNLVSRFKCLMLGDQISAPGEFKTPFAFSPLLVRREKLFYNLTRKLEELCSRIEGQPSTLCITDKFRGKDVLYLHKISSSLRHHFNVTGLSKKEAEHLLDQVKEILLSHLKGKSHGK